MSAIASAARAERIREILARTPEERFGLAVTLSETSIALLMQTRGVDRAEAIRVIRRGRMGGRTPSACHDE